MNYVSAVWLVALGLAAGCIQSINVEFDTCEHNGETVSVGAVLSTADGCGKCTCQPDGMMQCDDDPCCIAPDGSTFEPGTVWSDGCTTCECGPDGSFGCGTGPPCICGEPAPPCEDIMGCIGTPACGDLGGWTCSYDCMDPCDPTSIPICESPPGCFAEVYCDEKSNTWFCGPTTCDCLGIPPEDCVALPGCISNPICDTFTGTWYCDEICPCETGVPNCGYFTTPACLGDVWECESAGSFCGDSVDPCPLHEDFNCASFPVCDAMLQSWTCTEECIPEYCPEPAAGCPPEPVGCFYFELCQLTGWECVLHCT